MRISDWSSDVCSSDLGRVRPTSGRVLFHGEAIQNELEHRIVGKGICRKFQTPGVLIGLSVIDNLAIAAMADRRWWKSFGKAGEVLIRENQAAPSLFYLAEGRALIQRDGADEIGRAHV